jgi:tetratricopeptide (TPR) repeat protein
MMRTTSSFVSCLAAILATVAVSQAQERHTHPPGADATRLGTVAFANSGADAAQAPFLRGLALLHSFEYDEAAEAFRAAQAADSSFAMAFWGEAVTYSHLLWGEDDVDAARRALNRLAPTRDARLARAKTSREQAYGAAVEALFADVDLSMRVRGFAEAMRGVTARYPDDLDAAAFTSLALMFVGQVGQLPPHQRQTARADAVTFAQRVFAADPNHPGGVHYLIHATDDPELAPRGLEAARRYAEIAPEAEHAQHMPSHIFVQLGLWSDAVASDERAWAASRAEIKARQLSNADLSFHSLQWLQYAYLQSGRYRASRGTIGTAREVLSGVDLSVPAYTDARYTVGWLEFQHAATTGDWSGAVCEQSAVKPPQQGVSDRERSFNMTASYQVAIAAVMCDRGATAIETLRKQVAALPTGPNPLRAALLHAELLTYIGGKPSANLDTLLADPATPSRAPVGPPSTLRLEELLGQARLKAGRPREAIGAYERALQLTPNRSSALLGLARARRAAGDAQGAAEAYRRLLDNWRHADADAPALKEAREGAGSK